MKPARVHRRRRGQAMVEYSMITWILLAGLLFLGSVPIFKTPTPGGGAVATRNVIEMMLEAYQHYYDGFFLVLSAPYP